MRKIISFSFRDDHDDFTTGTRERESQIYNFQSSRRIKPNRWRSSRILCVFLLSEEPWNTPQLELLCVLLERERPQRVSGLCWGPSYRHLATRSQCVEDQKRAVQHFRESLTDTQCREEMRVVCGESYREWKIENNDCSVDVIHMDGHEWSVLTSQRESKNGSWKRRKLETFCSFLSST